MDIAITVRNVHEIIKEDISGTFDASLVFRKAKERGNTELTESSTLQSLEFLRKMRIIEGTSDSGKEFKITDVGLNVPLELVEKNVRLYMERNMCQDSRVIRS